jgi:hypothetical protein
MALFLHFRVTGLWTQLVFEASIVLKSQPDKQARKSGPFPFADPSLRSISQIASQNSLYDMLVERMVDIPGLLQDVDVLSGRRGNAMLLRNIARQVFSRAVTIAEKLRLALWLLIKIPRTVHVGCARLGDGLPMPRQ